MTKSTVVPWVRVALNILLVVAISVATAVTASFLFPDPILVATAADFLVPVAFIILIWVRKRMISEPPMGHMSIHAKVCMALIAAMIVLPVLGGITANDQAEYNPEWELERDIRLSSVTRDQEFELITERMVCVGEGGGRDSISQEDLDACDQIYHDRKYKFQLENYYANQTANDEVSMP